MIGREVDEDGGDIEEGTATTRERHQVVKINYTIILITVLEQNMWGAGDELGPENFFLFFFGGGIEQDVRRPSLRISAPPRPKVDILSVTMRPTEAIFSQFSAPMLVSLKLQSSGNRNFVLMHCDVMTSSAFGGRRLAAPLEPPLTITARTLGIL